MNMLENSNLTRLTIFFGVLVACAILERLFPRRKVTQSRGRRWVTNLALGGLNSAMVALAIPMTVAGFALYVNSMGFGLFNALDTPLVVEIISSIVLLDAFIYLQHRAFHQIGPLWRLHRVHHADRDLDVSSGLRFHPLEIAVSVLFKMACVALLGASVLAVILFEVVLNASAMFNHSNLKLSRPVDTWLRRLIVTPDMHRIHHSVIPEESNRNFGFFLSVWDQLFRTHQDQPALGHLEMTIGLGDLQNQRPSQFGYSLRMPFFPIRPG